MEDDNAKEDESSTSAKENMKGPGSEDMKPEDNNREEDENSRVESASSLSSSSVNSHLYLASSGHKVPKPAIGPKESKLREKKKNRRTNSGRIEKRPYPRRRAMKKPIKRRMVRDRTTKKRRKPNILAAFSPFTSRSPSPISRCGYCGHRCCRRRYKEARRDAFRKRREQKKLKSNLKANQMKRGQREKIRKKSELIFRSESLQAGSTSLMLSPLCENKADVPTIDSTAAPAEQPVHCDITPEMIYESMRRLSMWRHDVATMAILEYIKRCYPVCHDIPALCEELTTKLDVAAKVGIVKATGVGRWQLMGALEKRHLSTNHVSLFWTIFADTMKPVTKKPGILAPPNEDNNATQTRKKVEEEDDADDEASIRTTNTNLQYEIA